MRFSPRCNARKRRLREDVEEQILLAHPEGHLAGMRGIAEAALKSPRHIDGDTIVSAGTWEAGRCVRSAPG